jgi:hypothetical protein
MLTAVVEIATLPAFHGGQSLPLRRAAALELIAAPGKFEVKRLGALEHSSDGINRLRVFRTANTAHLGRGIGQEQWLRVGPSEKYVAR